jgi:uncharacterized protein YbbC (DUF1343 family)
MRSRIVIAVTLISCALLTHDHAVAIAAPAKLPRAEPADVGMNAARLAWIEPLVAQAIRAKRLPGCVVLIARHGRVAYFRAFGDRQIEPARVAMTTDTVFDMASLTKPLATATSVMILAERRKLRIEDPVAKYLPNFAQQGKDKITIEQLLTHQGGLVPDNAVKDYLDGPQKAWQRIDALKLQYSPGSKFVYSDVGYLVLGELVHRVSGQPIDDFSRDNIFRPLGISETGYLPAVELRQRAAPTERRDGKWIQGEVHDPRAFHLGGVAGHAGLFSTADDLAVYAQMMLGRGDYGGARILAAETVRQMTTPRDVAGKLRGLGWDIRSGYSINRGELYSPLAFGHGGFTGTVLWIDPQLDLTVVFLSNRLHPAGKGEVNRLAGQIGTVAGAAILDRSSQRAAAIPLPGIDVLVRDGFRQLAGRHVGLITNQTGRDRHGTSTAQLLHAAAEVKLVALFSPEHGIAGTLDTSHIGDARDETTGLPVFSLYGTTRRPTADSLRGIDTLVFDIQDVGTRFYTYISTLGLAMQAAAERKIRFVVLDRPNPLGGQGVEGPMLDAGRESFVGFHALPVRHGMTVGELSRLFNDELHLGLDLQVIPVEGWRRADDFDATGLSWVNPSPNLRSVTAAYLYPGIGLLETTNVSVGRGTDTPFELLGAPWIDGLQLAEALNAVRLPGIRFLPTRFTPTGSTHGTKPCQGMCMILLDRAALRPVRTGLEIAAALHRLYPKDWKPDGYMRLLGNRATFDGLLAGKPVAELEAAWQPELQAFCERRAKHLIYEVRERD